MKNGNLSIPDGMAACSRGFSKAIPPVYGEKRFAPRRGISINLRSQNFLKPGFLAGAIAADDREGFGDSATVGEQMGYRQGWRERLPQRIACFKK